jgi:hypothetical protein
VLIEMFCLISTKEETWFIGWVFLLGFVIKLGLIKSKIIFREFMNLKIDKLSIMNKTIEFKSQFS